jgi:hypothetical protein
MVDRSADERRKTMCTRTLRTFRRLSIAVSATVAVAAVVATSAIATGVPGEPGCLGRDTASFAQDWKAFSFEPAGVGPLVRFYGGTNPSDWLQGERHEDCAP